tara:strand:- start:2216 stop:3385 length:1170 start_codon:yes stop_codon:yes gene_type:complete
MKKYKYIIAISIIMFNCKSERNYEINEAQKSTNLELIQKQKSELKKQINLLQIEVKKLDNIIEELDENKKYKLVNSIKLKFEQFKHFIEIQGSLESDKNLELYPEIPGIINNIFVKQGEKVFKGDILAELVNTEIIAQLEQLKLQLYLAKTKYERQANLWSKKIGTEIQFLQAKTNYLTLEKKVEQIKGNVKKSKIIAPFDGVIDEIISDSGSNVSPGFTPILRIINLDEIKVTAEVPEVHLPYIKKGAKVSLYIPVISKRIDAKIASIGNVINPNNRNFRIEIIIENKIHNLKPNMTVQISVNDYVNNNSILVAQNNIIENSLNKFYVYRLESLDNTKEKHRAIKTYVKLGKKLNNKIEILEGLEPGDLIVEEGVRLINDQEIVKIIK